MPQKGITGLTSAQTQLPRTESALTAPTRTGQPMRADARRNRARVLEAAQAAFADEGLLVPLDEIARRAGVGAGTVYRHFPTKEMLFETVILERVRGFVERARALTYSDRPGEALFDLVTSMAEESSTKRDLIDALAGAGIDVTSNLAEVNRELQDMIALLLASAQRAGAVRDDVGITDVMALLRGAFLATCQKAGETRMAVAVICDGLRSRTPAP